MQKGVYNDATGKLRKVKHDIERIQQILEQNKKRLQKDFEYWYQNLRKEATDGIKEIVEDAREEKRAEKAAMQNRLVAMEGGSNLPLNRVEHLPNQMGMSGGLSTRR